MRQILTRSILIILPILVFSACQERAGDIAKDSTEDAAALLNIPENILGDNEVIFSFTELPIAERNQSVIFFPDAALPILDSIKIFLDKNPDQLLRISGMYSPSEDVPEGYENLGLARADFLAEKMRSLGVDGARIQVSSVMEDLAFDAEGLIKDAYRFAFVTKETAPANEMDRTVYFWAAEDLIRFDPELKDYCAKAGQYLETNSGAKMILTGHTDYNGNKLLGEMRAESLKDYFGRFGLDTSRVVIRSEGPDKPVAPNDTQENKSKNRRVEITFE